MFLKSELGLGAATSAGDAGFLQGDAGGAGSLQGGAGGGDAGILQGVAGSAGVLQGGVGILQGVQGMQGMQQPGLRPPGQAGAAAGAPGGQRSPGSFRVTSGTNRTVQWAHTAAWGLLGPWQTSHVFIWGIRHEMWKV